MAVFNKMRIKATEQPVEQSHRMAVEEYNGMIDESFTAAREGRVISHSALKEEMQESHGKFVTKLFC